MRRAKNVYDTCSQHSTCFYNAGFVKWGRFHSKTRMMAGIPTMSQAMVQCGFVRAVRLVY